MFSLLEHKWHIFVVVRRALKQHLEKRHRNNPRLNYLYGSG